MDGWPPPQFAPTAEGPVRYAQAGEGRDVLLLHGAMACLEDMLLGPFGAVAGRFRATAFDRPGYGETPRGRLKGGLADQAGRLRLAARALGVQRPILLAHSFGCAVALRWALAWPDEVAGLVLISPIAFPELRFEHLLFGPRAPVGAGDVIAYGPGPLMDAAILPLLWTGLFAPQAMPERYRRAFPFPLACGPSQMQAVGEEAVQAMPDLAQAASLYALCRTPAAILFGSADRVALPQAHAQPLAALLPDAAPHRLEGLGHMLHQFEAGAVLEALAGLAARSPGLSVPA